MLLPSIAARNSSETVGSADLGTMEAKLERDAYTDFESFVADARLIFSNCKHYNHESSQYAKLATRMEKFLDECLAKLPSYKQETGLR
jgi:histone acetyltransferase